MSNETWQPIETAPRLWCVLVSYPTNKGRKVVTATHMLDGWKGFAASGTISLNNEYKPTHWMPLPQPPEDKADD